MVDRTEDQAAVLLTVTVIHVKAKQLPLAGRQCQSIAGIVTFHQHMAKIKGHPHIRTVNGIDHQKRHSG